MRTTTSLGVALTVALSSGAASATTVKPMRVSQVFAAAEYIFVGTATKSSSHWEDGKTTIRSYLTFTNLDVKKGKIDGDSFTIRYKGGTVGKVSIWMGEFPRFEIGKRYLLYIRGNRKYESPIVGFHQGMFEVTQIGGQQVLKNSFGRPLVGVKNDRFVFLAKAKPKVAGKGKMVFDPNFKPKPADPNADAIERRELLRRMRRVVNRRPVEVPSTGPVSTKPIKLTPTDPGDQPPPEPSPKKVAAPEETAQPILLSPKDHDGKRMTLTQFLSSAKVR